MSTYATIIVSKANQTAAQELTSPEMFTTELKKNFKSYYVSLGFFPDEYYNSLVNSTLIYASSTDKEQRLPELLQQLGMTYVVTGAN
mgnify:FL=1|tara:strand:+ start:461 stop:721 length:261 start_codon:yes stop_codon:yes gene_type:complete